MSPAFESAAIDLTTAVRTTIDLAVRAATWVLLDDDGIREARDDLDAAFEASDAGHVPLTLATTPPAGLGRRLHGQIGDRW